MAGPACFHQRGSFSAFLFPFAAIPGLLFSFWDETVKPSHSLFYVFKTVSALLYVQILYLRSNWQAAPFCPMENFIFSCRRGYSP
jgi:hypothetical protein